MRVVHLSPAAFAGAGRIGGGERYAYELARAVAERHETVFVTFAARSWSGREGPLRVEHLAGGPLRGGLHRWIRWGDVIHCHQVHTLSTDVALLLGRLFGKRVFVTELGGGERYALSYHLPILKWARAFLLISEYSRRLAAETPRARRPARLEVVYGGVDTAAFTPGADGPRDGVLFVGRLLAHKGIDYLIEAVDGTTPLAVVGRPCDPDYLRLLQSKSAGKAVRFYTAVDDAELVRRYRAALVTVQPSVYRDCFGRHTRVPELLGLAALESLACGTPAIVSSVGSLPEVVEDGATGYVVPPNDPAALRERIDYLRANPDVAREMGRKGRAVVERQFTWEAVARRCEAAYAVESAP